MKNCKCNCNCKNHPTKKDYDHLLNDYIKKTKYINELVKFIQAQGKEMWNKWCKTIIISTIQKK